MSAFTKAASATCIAGAIAITTMAGAMSASAAPVDCATLGATTIAPGICEVVFTANGTFTVPAGVTHLEALLVAGGTAGLVDDDADGYGDPGLGGEVDYLSDVPTDEPLTVVVGTGGTTAGAPATLTSISNSTGGAAAQPAVTSINGSAGVLPSVVAASPLFPAFAGEQPLAGDGEPGTLSTGGDPGTDWTPAGGGTVGTTYVNARPNSGAGGGGASASLGGPLDPGNGADGLVLFRFAAPEAAVAPQLAATGVDVSVSGAAAGTLLLGGAAILAAGLRRRARA